MRNFKRFILGLTAIVLLFVFSFNKKIVVASDFIPPGDGENFVVSHRKTELVPGVVENEVIYNDSTGKNPVSGFLVDINLGSNVGIMASTKNYNETGTQTVMGMAEASQNATGRNIVAGINADLNWSGTGLSNGVTIVDGKVITDRDSAFFGIKKDGSAIIGTKEEYSGVKSELEHAVRGMGWLIRDGEITTTSTSLAPRTAVGIKEDGTVFFYVVEGRAFPRSVGIGLKELAEIMKSYGAVRALNLDGGGSTTYIAKRPGVGQLEIRSHLSDGRERASISSLFVYAEEGDGLFNKAEISTDSTAYTPKSIIQFNARGVDNGGGPANLPNDLTWEVENNDLGAIDQNGLFESSGEEGEVVVNLRDSNGRVVGSHSIDILIPDELEFRASEYSLAFNEETDFGLRVLNNKQELNYKDGDIDWKVEILDEKTNEYELDVDKKLGTFHNNKFTSNEEDSLFGRITATVKSNEDVSVTFDVIVGQLPRVLFDFEDDEINDLWIPQSVNGAKTNIEIVSRNSGEPVRFGEKALRLDFDYRERTSNVAGAYGALDEGIFDTDVELELSGNPDAVGMWIYGTEEAQGLWLRSGIGVEGTTAWKSFDLTTEEEGINWLGWKFVTLDLSDQVPPFTMLDHQFIRLMTTPNSFGGNTDHMPYGSIYVDNITAIYGYNPEDTDSPEIDSLSLITPNAEEFDIYYDDVTHQVETNSFTIESTFYDIENEYTTGINYDDIYIYVDGVDYSDLGQFEVSATERAVRLQNIYLDDGIHEIKVIVIDNAGNEGTITRYINVNSGSNPLLYFENDIDAILGSDYNIILKSNESENIDNINLSFKISNELEDFELEFMDGFNGTYEYVNSLNILNIEIEKTESTTSDKIFKLISKIDDNLIQGTNIRYSLQSGTYRYLGNKNTFDSFSMEPYVESVSAPLTLTSDTILLGQDGVFYVHDVNGNPISDAEIFLIDGSKETSLGTTDENGMFITDRFMENVEAFELVAKINGDISFALKGQSLDSSGDEDGTPFAITANVGNDPTTDKNITWLSNTFAEKEESLIRFGLVNEFDETNSSTYEVVSGHNEMLVFTGSTSITSNYAININGVNVTGLEPGKEYKYQVGNGEVWSETRSFKTVHKYSEVDFFIMGDIQSSNFENILKHSNAIGNDVVDYDFGIQVGDFVDNAGRYDHWFGTLDAISNSTIGDIDIIKVLGNHEFYGDPSGDNAKTIFNYPDKKDYFSVEYGMVYIGVLGYDVNRESLTEKLEWMVEDANNSNAHWKILVTHQPPYYTNPQGGNGLIHELLPSYAEEANFDFVIAGHDHTFARTRPLINGEIDTNGVRYVIAGAFGEKGYALTPTDFEFEQALGGLNHIYLSVNATHERLSFELLDATSGELLDSFRKIKPLNHEEEHDYILEGDRIVCYECGYSRELDGYVGFLKDQDGNIMYHLSNDFHKGIYFWDENIYYFDEDGKALIGTHEVFGLETTFNERGEFVSGGTGFVNIDNKTYYYKSLELVRHTGITKIEGKYYYFSSIDFSVRKGLYRIAGITYLFDEKTGEAYHGINYYNGIKFESDEKGKVLSGGTGFVKEEGKIYYYIDFELQKSGYQIIDGHKYYIRTSTGEVVTGKYGLYTFDEYGRLIEGRWLETDKGVKYIWGGEIGSISGEEPLIGFQEIDGDIYYFDEEGYLMIGTIDIDGFIVETDENGVIQF